jgi:hypothetical protein
VFCFLGSLENTWKGHIFREDLVEIKESVMDQAVANTDKNVATVERRPFCLTTNDACCS